MDSSPELPSQDLVELTSEIVSAYVTHNKVSSEDLPGVITSVHGALQGLDKAKQREPEKPTPMVPIKKSITADYLISLEDGKRYKSLKRHLSGRGLTPPQYREKWGLPKDYPMVAPNYAQQRSELAKALGLGQQRRKRPTDTPPAEAAQPAAGEEGAPAPRRRGRPRATAAAT
ncbi:MAG TPA: MucR family transcriptional regulator [Enterovirga sp.]|jgi:predicted transcriptional regulator|nr:MucR family transcriptional regulator [Enterovirga sp.]